MSVFLPRRHEFSQMIRIFVAKRLLLMFRTFLLSRRDLISVEKGHAPPQKVPYRDVINCVPTARFKRVNSVSFYRYTVPIRT